MSIKRLLCLGIAAALVCTAVPTTVTAQETQMEISTESAGGTDFQMEDGGIKAAEAAGGIQPTVCDNLLVTDNSDSSLAPTDNGYMRVYYDTGHHKIGIEYYDDDFAIQRKQSLDMKLNIWGGFYAGSDAYYLVEGQYSSGNPADEVIRVIKYDTNWQKQGTAKITSNLEIFGGDVSWPFKAGCVEMAEYGGTLYIVTGHEGYVDPGIGQGHQGFLMIAIDKASMTGNIIRSDLDHSFAQYIAVKDSHLYVLEQSEGFRCTQLSRYNAEGLEKLPNLITGMRKESAFLSLNMAANALRHGRFPAMQA